MELRHITGKRGAFEMSMTTVVIIVLSMTMLILGLTLVRTIFTGAKYNVEQINDKVRDSINSLFLENANEKLIVYLPNLQADIKQGESYGVAFAIKNIESAGRTFQYTVTPSGGNCPTGVDPATWIVVGGKDTVSISSGDTAYLLTRFRPPLTTPLCINRFKISVLDYKDAFFDVEIKS